MEPWIIIVISTLVAALSGLLGNIVASRLEPRIGKHKRLVVGSFILFTALIAVTAIYQLPTQEDEIGSLIIAARKNDAAGKTQDAVSDYEKAKALAKSQQELSRAIDIEIELAELHFRNQSYKVSLDYYEQSLSLIRMVIDKKKEASILWRMGDICFEEIGVKLEKGTQERSKYLQDAIGYYKESLLLDQATTKDNQTQYLLLERIGDVSVADNHISIAIANYEKAMGFTSTVNKNSFREIRNKLGWAYYHTLRLDLAMKVFSDAYPFCQGEKFEIQVCGGIAHGIANVLFDRMDYVNALPYYEDALGRYLELGDTELIFFVRKRIEKINAGSVGKP